MTTHVEVLRTTPYATQTTRREDNIIKTQKE